MIRHLQVISYKTSTRHLEITLMHLQDRLIKHLSDVFCKTSTIYLAKISSRCLTKMSFRLAFETSFGHLQDVLGRCLACLGKTSLRHLADVFLPTRKILSFPSKLSSQNSLLNSLFLMVQLCWAVHKSFSEKMI